MIYDDIMRELDSRQSYKASVYAPYYICSYAVHVFNLMNRQREVYWESKRLPNMRMHVVFVAPPGFMKSYYLGVMGGDAYGIFKNCGTNVGYEQSMSEAGFIGTVVNMNGVGFPEYGAAYQFKEGVLLVDEFSAITDAMHVQYNTQLSTQLLAALDHGNVHKRLANGKIAYETSLTLWAGVQPARYDLSSGLGRRLFFLLFLPTRDDNEQLMRTMHATRNLRPNRPAMEGLWHKIDHFRQSMDVIQKVEFDNDVLDIYFKLGLYSYESAYFDRLMLGYQLAMYGPEKHVVVNTKDQELLELVTREKLWRDEIAKGVDYTQIIRIIEELGGKVTKAMLVEEAIMVGWNAEQVYSTLADMSKYGVVRFQGPYVELIR